MVKLLQHHGISDINNSIKFDDKKQTIYYLKEGKLICGSDGIDGKLMLGFGILCKFGLIFLTADIALCGAALIPAYKTGLDWH